MVTYGSDFYGASLYGGDQSPLPPPDPAGVLINFIGGPFDGERQMAEDVPHEPGDVITIYTDRDPGATGTYAYLADGPSTPGPDDPNFAAQYIFTYVPAVT